MTATEPHVTKRQREVYEFVADHGRTHGYCCTVRDIQNHFGFRSPNGAMCHLLSLRRKGLVTWEGRHPRTIRVTEANDGI